MCVYGIRPKCTDFPRLTHYSRLLKTLRADGKKQWTDASGKKNTSHFTKSKSETDRKETPAQVPNWWSVIIAMKKNIILVRVQSQNMRKALVSTVGKWIIGFKNYPIKKESKQGSDKLRTSKNNTMSSATKNTSSITSNTTALMEEQ